MSAPAVTNTTWPYRTIPDIDAYLTSANQAWATERRIINGRPLKVFINQHASLRDFFEVSMAAGGDKEYIIDQGVDGKLKRTTYNKASLEVDRIANLLRSYGCVKGDRIAIISRNTREWITTFWAIACIGGIASAVNAFSTPEVLAFCLTLTTSKVVVIDQERAFMLAPFVDRLHAAGCSQILVVNGKGATKGMKDFAEELRNAPLVPSARIKIDFEDPATIFFTSGTTGMPKAVLSTNRQYLSNLLLTRVSAARTALRRGEELPVPAADAPQMGVLLSVPLFHVTGNQSFLALSTFAGAKVFLLYKWTIEGALKAVKDESLTIAGGVPFMVMQLIGGLDKSTTLNGVTFGGQSSSSLLPALLEEKLGSSFGGANQAYGLTESNSIITSFSCEDYARKPTSCGIPSPVNEFRIVSMENGAIMKQGLTGEISVRGPNIATGYWANPKATAEAFSPDGFFKTGDVGYLDPEGMLYISDRAKEIIIRGGENISTIAVEDALYTDRRIKDAACVPVADEKMGELVAAFVTIKDQFRGNPPTEAELIAHVRTILPRHAVPVMVVVDPVGEIIRNATGKTLKSAIKIDVAKIWKQRTESKL